MKMLLSGYKPMGLHAVKDDFNITHDVMLTGKELIRKYRECSDTMYNIYKLNKIL